MACIQKVPVSKHYQVAVLYNVSRISAVGSQSRHQLKVFCVSSGIKYKGRYNTLKYAAIASSSVLFSEVVSVNATKTCEGVDV
jgi:hypothetical protein